MNEMTFELVVDRVHHQFGALMAGIVAISVLGLLIGAFISGLERVLLAWR